MAGVSEEDNLVGFVDPGVERETVTQRPLERARHHLQELLDTAPYNSVKMFIGMSRKHPPRLPALKVLSHVIARALGAPRLGRAIIGVQQDHVVLLLGPDAVSHDMASRTHPPRHLGVLNEAPQIGVGQEQIGGDDRTVGSIAGIDRLIDVSDDHFPDHRLDTVGAEDEVAIESLAGAEGDRGRIGVDGGDKAVEAESDERDGDVVEELVEVGTLRN